MLESISLPNSRVTAAGAAVHCVTVGRMPFDGCPPDGKFPGDDSPVVWSVHYDECTGTCTIRSLLYPGFMGYYVPATKSWGYCYIGTGEKNLDIAFMLP